jgi:hypothetical protein
MIYIPCDIEANGFLSKVNKVHCLSMNWGGDIKTTSSYDDIRKLVSRKDITLVGHNFQTYDVPVIEKILDCKVVCGVIDTLALSWYLYPNRSSHGLADWGVEFGIPKPAIEDWENLPQEQYNHRCEEDVKIQTQLWFKIKKDLDELYDNDEDTIHTLLRYLSFKMYQFRLIKESKIKVDIPKIHENIDKLEKIKQPQYDILKEALPKVGAKSNRVPPAKPYNKDGSLSAQGLKWKKLTEERGLPFEHNESIVVIKSYDEPNPDSSAQVKDWLFSLGWKPLNFSHNKKNGNEVPQVYIKVGEDSVLCPSIKKLKHPAIEALNNYGVIKHRINTLKGYLEKQKDGFMVQGVGGFTNTLRITHRDVVNVPKNSKPWGSLVREVFVARGGNIICGADLSSLENKTRDHFIYPFDPDYVNEMADPDFDSHTDTAVTAGLMTKEEEIWFKKNKKNKKLSLEDQSKLDRLSDLRQLAKTCNYSSVYGVGANKLASTLDIKVSEAKNLIDGYWKRNWSVKAFSKTIKTKKNLGLTWALNPVNGFYYELRNEKDIFSTINQSTGSYAFDVWLGFCLAQRPQLTLQNHDDQQLELPDTPEEIERVKKILQASINKLNKKLSLNVDLSIDINLGYNYSQTH